MSLPRYQFLQACYECSSIEVDIKDVTEDDDIYIVIQFTCRECGETWEDEYDI